MPCICDTPSTTWEKHLEMMLEQALRYLTLEQIISIVGSSAYIGACEWYRSHLMHDFYDNYQNKELREFYQKEANRLGWKLVKIDSGVKIES